MATPSSNALWIPDAVYGFAECTVQAKRLAAALNVPYQLVEAHSFPDGESRIRVASSARHAALYRSLDHPNTKLIEVLLASSALRDQGAAMITLIAPYLPYMRQDIAFHSGEAVSQKVIGLLLAGAFDRFVAVDPHLHRTPELSTVFAGKPSLALSGASAITGHLKTLNVPRETLIVGPDEESAALTRAVAEPLGLQWAVGRKERRGDRDVTVSLPSELIITRRPVVIVDDVISSGATIVAIAQMIHQRGARSIFAYTTHALCDEGAVIDMRKAGIDRLLSCDGVPHSSNGMAIVDVIVNGLKAAQ